LAALTRDLLNQWEQTKESWRDDKSKEFESRYLVHLDAEVATALDAIEKLDELVSKVRSDCE